MVAEGRIKIGDKFLKIGDKYLRIGPAPTPPVGESFLPVKSQFDTTSSLDMSFTPPGFVAGEDVVLIMALHSVGANVASFSYGGDLTWTVIDTQSATGGATDDYWEWAWAVLPADSGATVSVDQGGSGNDFFASISGFTGIDTGAPIQNFQFTVGGGTTVNSFFTAAVPSMGWAFWDDDTTFGNMDSSTYLPGPSDTYSDGLRWGLDFPDNPFGAGGQFPMGQMYSFYDINGGQFSFTTSTTPVGGNQKLFQVQLEPA